MIVTCILVNVEKIKSTSLQNNWNDLKVVLILYFAHFSERIDTAYGPFKLLFIILTEFVALVEGLDKSANDNRVR